MTTSQTFVYSVIDANANPCVLGALVMNVKDVHDVASVNDVGVLDARVMYALDVNSVKGVDGQRQGR